MGDGPNGQYTYVGLDVHKATVCVALAESGRDGEVRQIGVFENRPEILGKMAAKLGSGGRRLSFCYKAGPCGYGLHRLLTGCGHSCIVVAPSLIPRKSGDRVKTDRRDAMMLAKLHRAGELTAIWIRNRRRSNPARTGSRCESCGLERRETEMPVGANNPKGMVGRTSMLNQAGMQSCPRRCCRST
jgi:transposase